MLALIRRKSKRGALRLETYLSTQSPAPGKNARLSHSHENSGRAQCYAAPPSEEPSSLDSLKSSFDLSSFPQDFSAATPKRVSAGLRRRAAPQRLTMHGLSPAQRVTTLTIGNHYAGAPGECGAPQSPAAARARGLPPEPSEIPGGWDILVNPREAVGKVTFLTLQRELLRVFPQQPPAATGRYRAQAEHDESRGDKFQDGVYTSLRLGPGTLTETF